MTSNKIKLRKHAQEEYGVKLDARKTIPNMLDSFAEQRDEWKEQVVGRLEALKQELDDIREETQQPEEVYIVPKGVEIYDAQTGEQIAGPDMARKPLPPNMKTAPQPQAKPWYARLFCWIEEKIKEG